MTLLIFRIKQEEMRASKTNKSLNLNVSDVTENVFNDGDSHNNILKNASDLPMEDLKDSSFVLSTEMCIYIHGGLLASIFIIGLLR